jgi:hypothetical protein
VTERADITVSIACIPPRAGTLLPRALQSVGQQTLLPDAVSIAYDIDHEGAPPTKQRALDAVRTEWTLLLDDDDRLMPIHAAELFGRAMETGADYVYSRFMIEADNGQLIEDWVFGDAHWEAPWDNANPRETTTTVLVRTALAKEVGFHLDHSRVPHNSGEDLLFVKDIVRVGGVVVNHPVKTWIWNHASGNTSGLPHRW